MTGQREGRGGGNGRESTSTPTYIQLWSIQLFSGGCAYTTTAYRYFRCTATGLHPCTVAMFNECCRQWLPEDEMRGQTGRRRIARRPRSIAYNDACAVTKTRGPGVGVAGRNETTAVATQHGHNQTESLTRPPSPDQKCNRCVH